MAQRGNRKGYKFFIFKQSPVSAIMMAIVLGIIVKNTIGVPRSFQPGVGLGTDIKKLKKLGAKPFWVGLCAAISVGTVSSLLIKIVNPFLAVIK